MKKQFSIFNFQFSIQSGFTLMELLVVIAIIAILSALLLVNFVGIRQRARDSTRKSDLRQIQSALELYRSDQSTYPTSIPPAPTPLTAGTPAITYLQKVPADPLGSSPFQYQFCFWGSGTNYALRACLENTNDAQKDPAPPGNDFTISGSGCTFTACSPAGVSFTLQNP